jgi:hypothetical protein
MVCRHTPGSSSCYGLSAVQKKVSAHWNPARRRGAGSTSTIMTIWSEGAAKSMTLISHLILIETVLSVLKHTWNVSISRKLRHAGRWRRLSETHTPRS